MSKAKGGLGKGLSALIRPQAPDAEERGMLRHEPAPAPPPAAAQQPRAGREADSTVELEVGLIHPNPEQPRADFDTDSLNELVNSIREKGIIQPVTVRRRGDGHYELISGERRIRALRELGKRSVPAYILDVRTNGEMLELALIENLQREHLNPIEIAISYDRLMTDVGMDAEGVAKKVGKDRSTIVNFHRLLKLPEPVKDALRKSRITMGHARALLGLAEERAQLRLLQQIIRKDLSVRQVENAVRERGKKPAAKGRPAARRAGPVEQDVAERIQQILATRVRVVTHDGGRGELVIEFYSHDDLGRLFDLLSTIRT